MKSSYKTLMLAAVLALAPAAVSAQVRFRTGVFVGPVYRPWAYNPYYYGPAYGPVWVSPSHSHRHEGQLKFETKDKDAEVFIDNAYAGTVRQMNSAWLREGSHELSVRDHGVETFHDRVYVTEGNTLHIKPEHHS